MLKVDHGVMFYCAVVGIAVVALIALYAIGFYGRMFWQEARGQRRLITLAGAALVIIVIINMFVGVLTQPMPVLTPPPQIPKVVPKP